jgi:hypothetical protein
MNTRRTLLLALATGGVILALPTRAADNLSAGAYLLARSGSQDASPGRENRRTTRRQDDGERSYGYGYERRQRSDRPDDPGGRDQQASREVRTERAERSNRVWRGDDRPGRRNRD